MEHLYFYFLLTKNRNEAWRWVGHRHALSVTKITPDSHDWPWRFRWRDPEEMLCCDRTPAKNNDELIGVSCLCMCTQWHNRFEWRAGSVRAVLQTGSAPLPTSSEESMIVLLQHTTTLSISVPASSNAQKWCVFWIIFLLGWCRRFDQISSWRRMVLAGCPTQMVRLLRGWC